MSHARCWPRLLVVLAIVLASFSTSHPVAQAAGKYLWVTTTEDKESALSLCEGTADNPPLITNPSQTCSLRQAMLIAKDNAGSTIKFFIPDSEDGNEANPVSPGYKDFGSAGAAWFIVPVAPLPTISADGTTIDGSSQTAKAGNRNINGSEIIILGSSDTLNSAGLTIISNQNVIRNLGIANFTGGNEMGIGIEIYGDANTIEGNYIGVSLGATGTFALGNTNAGIRVRGNNNIIGGDNALSTVRFNVIAGNTNDGVLIDGSRDDPATSNIIQGNYIGIAPNLAFGGGPTFFALPNGGHGVQIRNPFSSKNRVGSPASAGDATLRNFISANKAYGILIKESAENEVYGNFIGLDLGGTARVPNEQGGIRIDGSLGTVQAPTARGNLIGSSASFFSHNYIAGNNGPGINIIGLGAASNTIKGNYIGLGSNNRVPTGTGPNHTVGILIERGANKNTVGGSAQFVPTVPPTFVGVNFIAGNDGDGVRIRGSSGALDRPANANIVKGNCIGTAPDAAPPFAQLCTTRLPNLGDGVEISGYARDNVVGDTTSTGINVISHNIENGVYIYGPTPPVAPGTLPPPASYIDAYMLVRNNSVLRNSIQYNDLNGIRVVDTANTVIDGSSATIFSIIADNDQNGVHVSRSYNTTLAASDIFRNKFNGALVDTGSATLTIRTTSVLTNSLSGLELNDVRYTNAVTLTARGNTQHGIAMTDSFTATLRTGTISRNGGDGIRMVNVGNASVRESSVYLNTADGIRMTGPRTITISSSSVYRNTGDGLSMTDPITISIGSSFVYTNTGDGIQMTNPRNVGINRTEIRGNSGDGITVSSDVANPQPRDVRITSNLIARNGVAPNTGRVGVRVTSSGGGRIDRVRITDNSITGNQVKGIEIEPETLGLPGDASFPNHDIDPPIVDPLSPLKVRLTQAGIMSGYVYTDTLKAAACITCTVQIFTTAGDGQGQTKVGEAQTDEVGFFRVQLSGVPPLPPEIVLTATDGWGNTSEFSTFTVSYGVEIGPDRSGSAIPGQTITYTHRITNTGSVDLLDLQLGAVSSQQWPFTLAPPGAINLEAGQSKPVTLTLTLPTGSATNVRAGLIDETMVTIASTSLVTVTDKALDRTTVLPKFVLEVDPLSRKGAGTPEAVIPYAHTLRNNGNITATVNIAAATDLGPNWVTTVSPSSITLAPGQAVDLLVQVTIPKGAQNNTTAVTTVNLTVPSDPSQNKVLAETTTVVLQPLATLVPDRVGFGAAGDRISFRHLVTNQSNGAATFRLNGSSSLGSRIRFVSEQPGIALTSNSFTLSNAPGQNFFNFFVEIEVERRALPGQIDLVTIYLTDDRGNVIGGASVQDRITIAKGNVLPRVWQPLFVLRAP